MIIEMRDEVIQKRGYTKSIVGDALSLEISSYPVTAKYLTKRLASYGDTICELCCGIGISLLEFSYAFDKVVGVDNDQQAIENAHNNLMKSGVKNYELLVGNVDDSDTLSKISTDIVAYDIPYWSDHQGSVKHENPDLKNIVEMIRSEITQDIVIYAPPHMTREDIAQIIEKFEYQAVWLNGKHDRNFIYLGSLINSSEPDRISLSIDQSE